MKQIRYPKKYMQFPAATLTSIPEGALLLPALK
jgi:hypothetical protein